MSLVKWAFIGVILLPAAEFAAFIVVALAIGWLWTAALFVATSAVGRAGAPADRPRRSRPRPQARSAPAACGRSISTPLASPPWWAGFCLYCRALLPTLLGALLFVPPVRRWVRATIGRAVKKQRAARDPSVIDLTPDEWHHVSDRIEDGRAQKRSAPRPRKRNS